MISLTRKQMNVGKGWKPIERMEVWFQTPMGLTSSLDEALQVCNSHKIDAEMGVSLRPVVINEDGYEVV